MIKALNVPTDTLQSSRQSRILVADVGATKTDIALYEIAGEEISCSHQARFVSKNFNSFLEVLQHFNYKDKNASALCVAFAGPVLAGKAKATNLDWTISTKALSRELGGMDVFLLNDLEAHAYGILQLGEEDFDVLHQGKLPAHGNAAIIAPGTGLGEAGLFWDGEKFIPFATEGGHCDFAARSEIEDLLLQHLRAKFGHVSWERVLSGPGLWNIYEFLRKLHKAPYTPGFNQFQRSKDKSLMVSICAKNNDPLCQESMQLFTKFLAVAAANLALKMNAYGGIFIAGGMIPNILDLIDKDYFRRHFYDMGRLQSVLERISVKVVKTKDTALKGAAVFALKGLRVGSREHLQQRTQQSRGTL